VPVPVTILFATVSGNAEELAGRAAEHLGAAGHATQVANVANFPAARLRETDTALIIASTWGEGEPPPDAADFCAALRAPAKLGLGHLRYAVLALGSSTYRDFCGCGRRIDEDLANCGARRLLARADCDTKYRAAFEAWLAQVEAALKTLA
jgi:sulfite reductase (NADPH) flavoprotein alpha-component